MLYGSSQNNIIYGFSAREISYCKMRTRLVDSRIVHLSSSDKSMHCMASSAPFIFTCVITMRIQKGSSLHHSDPAALYSSCWRFPQLVVCKLQGFMSWDFSILSPNIFCICLQYFNSWLQSVLSIPILSQT